jgi:hypothetical protein
MCINKENSCTGISPKWIQSLLKYNIIQWINVLRLDLWTNQPMYLQHKSHIYSNYPANIMLDNLFKHPDNRQ